MDTAVAVDDSTSGVVVHARSAHVVLAGLDARLPFLRLLIAQAQIAELRPAQGLIQQGVRAHDAAEVDVPQPPIEAHQRTPQPIAGLSELDAVVRIGGTLEQRAQAPMRRDVKFGAPFAEHRTSERVGGAGRISEPREHSVRHRATLEHIPGLQERLYARAIERTVRFVGRAEVNRAIEQSFLTLPRRGDG